MKYIIITSLIALSVISVNTQTAQAGPFDWIKEKAPTQIIKNSTSVSLDNIYANILKNSESKKEASTITDKTIEASTSVSTVSTVSTRPAIGEKTVNVVATGYSSTPDQTDDSPFITASGTYVRDGIVAANFLPIGTRIKIPEYFGDKIFVVEDRMNKRYWHRVDIWFADRQAALNWGARNVTIEIVS